MKIAINGEILEVSGGGGGLPEGTVAVKPLTQAEYDALTDEEKQADVVYAITDDGGSGGGSSGEVYSTEEKAVGVWIDGKTVYERSVSGTFPDTANTNNEATLTLISLVGTELSFDTVVSLHANVYTTLGWISIGIGDPVRNIVARVTDKKLTLMSLGASSTQYVLGRKAAATIRYTKTTDTGGAA